jgi:hypothetical protein
MVDMPLKDYPEITVPVDMRDIIFAILADMEGRIYTDTAPRYVTKDGVVIPDACEKRMKITDDIARLRQLIMSCLK